MPEEKQTSHFESGRATPPQSVCYSSLIASTSEEYTHNIGASTNSSGQNSAPISQSLLHTNFNNFNHQRTQSSPASTYDYSPCPSSPYYSPSTNKTNITNLPTQSSHFSTDYLPSTTARSSTNSTSPSNNFSLFTNICNNNNSCNSNNNFEFITSSKTSSKGEESFYVTPETFNFQSPDQLSSASLNCSKVSKSNAVSTLKHTSTYLHSQFPSNTQIKYCQNKESVDLCLEKNTKAKKNSEGSQKFVKTVRDENFEESQEFLSKNGTKSKNTQEAIPDLVTDSFLHLFHKKNSQEALSYDLGDLSPILVSLSSKYKSEEISGLKKKESNEDFKLMNDFLAKIILEKEEKRFKTLDDRKKVLHKETFDDLDNELDERKVKRDAMSQYQEDKNHHKRSSNYGDYNQWEYFNQQDIQTSNNHRRGHFSFSGSSQQHSVGWNPIGIGMSRQTTPYYANPHGHMMPAHAHSEYRYNQWNNPNHKNMPNVHNAHSQNTVLPQAKTDMKHHADNSVQDFGLPIGSTSDFSKFRTATRDLMHRSPSTLTEKSTRTGIHTDHIAAIPPAIRNSSMRTPTVSSHPKTVINNPLSDLQMLVTNQESENLPQKADSFQQESVDLSAHSDSAKQKENSEDKPMNGNSSKDLKEFRSPVSVIQIQNKPVRSDFKEVEKPVELTSKSVEKSVETITPPSENRNDLGNNSLSGESGVESVKETVQNEVLKTCEESVKASVIVGKCGESSSGDMRNEGSIPEKGNIKVHEKEQTEDPKAKSKQKGDEEQGNVVEGESLSQKVDPNVTNKETDKPQKSAETTEEVSNEPAAKGDENLESSKGSKRTAEEEVCGEKKKVFLEVESQLEKLFDGSKVENPDLANVTSTSVETKTVSNEVVKKTPKKKPSRKSRIGRLSSGQSSGSERSLPCKKSKSAGSKEDGKKKIKKSLCDVMERRGPFLHVEGSKESPASVILVNFPKGDDEDEKEKSSAKKQNLNASRTKHHNELDFRGRSRNGLYSSTLSARYDAHTTDHTWICVFCKKGPHYSTMGDLFGPYIISNDETTSLGDFSGDEKDISDAQKRGGRNKKSIRSNNMVEHFQKMSRKLRRTQSTESCLTGMTVISDDQTDQLRYEVWVHEQCAVWSPNVFLIGSRIVGMQEAIWCSVKTMCSKCGISGANIGCVYRNCPNRSHYLCAKESGWSLEQESFISTCHIHKPRS